MSQPRTFDGPNQEDIVLDGSFTASGTISFESTPPFMGRSLAEILWGEKCAFMGSTACFLLDQTEKEKVDWALSRR